LEYNNSSSHFYGDRDGLYGGNGSGNNNDAHSYGVLNDDRNFWSPSDSSSPSPQFLRDHSNHNDDNNQLIAAGYGNLRGQQQHNNMKQHEHDVFFNLNPIFVTEFSTFLAQNIRPQNSELDILDSGTSCVISRIKSDFLKLNSDTSVRFKTVGGSSTDPIASFGRLRSNELDFSYGIYKPDLPVRRLLPTTTLNQSGFRIHLMEYGEKSVIQSAISSYSKLLVNANLEIPYLKEELLFGDKLFRKIDQYFIDDDQPEEGRAQKRRKFEFNNANIPFEENFHLLATSNYVTALEAHRRRGHINIPGVKVDCPECNLAKGRKASVLKKRKEKYFISIPLYQLDVDFMGPINPASIRGYSYMFVAIDLAISHPFVFGCVLKSDCYDKIRELVNGLRASDSMSLSDKVVFKVRSDNEFVFTKGPWKRALLDLKIEETHSVPYTPQQNGGAERYMSTQKSGVRAMLVGCDIRLWCYGYEYFAQIWVTIARAKYPRAPQFNGMSPAEARKCRKEYKPDDESMVDLDKVNEGVEEQFIRSKEREKYFRRFGCLCYYLREPREVVPKTAPKRRKAVFLGMSNKGNSAWRLGTYMPHKGRLSGYQWSEIESKDVLFVESVVISNLESLKDNSPGVVVTDEKLLNIACGSARVPPVVGENSPCARGLGAHRGPVDQVTSNSPMDPNTPMNPINDNSVNLETIVEDKIVPKISEPANVENTNTNMDISRKQAEVTDTVTDIAPVNEDFSKQPPASSSSTSPSSPTPKPPSPADLHEAKVLAEQKQVVAEIPEADVGKVKKKVGRPPGSKDKQKRKPRKTKKDMDALKTAFYADSYKTSIEKISDSITGDTFVSDKKREQSRGMIYDSFFSSSSFGSDFEDGERIIETYFQISVGAALKSEDAPKWIQAITKERTKLLAFQTWRNLSDAELQNAKNPVPVALILTKKRCGTYKCRAVCLGNLYKHDGHLEVYASVISMAANRYMIADCAHSGDFMVLFDIDNAFVQSLIDKEVFVRLPPQWRESEKDSGIRKLVRALYGLPQSPRLWAKHYEKSLVQLGWEQASSRGLWRKPSKACPGKWLRLGVFVDDNTCTGPDLNELNAEIEKVLAVFPGKIIKPDKMPDNWLRYDLLGTDVWYRRETRELKVTMERYIKRLASRFFMEKCEPVPSPCFDEARLYDPKSNKSEFHLREAIGCLSWAATVCRIDISHPVNVLSRVASREPTKSMAKCAKIIIAYLIHNPTVGLYYSPQNEASFNKTYAELSGEATKHWNLFSDASFASCFITMKSISGSICYYRAFPIIWKGQRQTIITRSTFESEYVAADDTLVVEESLDFKGFFGESTEDNLWLDNQTAVTVSKTASGSERPKSRHVALRHMRVSAVGDKIRFCPTQHQKADILTKSRVTQAIRDHVFHHNPEMKNPRKQKKEEEEQTQEEMDGMFTSAEVKCCFLSILQYLAQ
jgi:hypothetical protein